MEQTENLGLNLISNSAEDKQMKFSAWRAKIAGTGDDSNMKIIDAAVGELQESVDGVMQDVESAMNDKADKTDTVLNTTLSMGRKAGTTVGQNSVAVGQTVEASGQAAHAEGSNTTASEAQAHAEGLNTTSSGVASHAEGEDTTASGDNSHAEGESTTASDDSAHAEGYHTTASGSQSHAEGGYTTASGDYAHAEGLYAVASRKLQHVFGKYNIPESGDHTTEGLYAEIVGNGTTSNNSNARTLDWSGNEWISGSLKLGSSNMSQTVSGHGIAIGDGSTATNGEGALAVGVGSRATGSGAIATGGGSLASGAYSSAMGGGVTASGPQAHAEGSSGTTASGASAHAEGSNTTASDVNAHAEGGGTTASGPQAHAEGGGTTASGSSAHAEGGGTTASGSYAHAEGLGTVANHASQHVFGEYNAADDSSAAATSRGNFAEIVGNGANSHKLSNARTLDWSGNEALAGDLTINKGKADETKVSELPKLDEVFASLVDGTNTTRLFKKWYELANDGAATRYELLDRWFKLLGEAWKDKVYILQMPNCETTSDGTITYRGDLDGKTPARTDFHANQYGMVVAEEWTDEDPMTWYTRVNGLNQADGTMEVLAIEGIDDTFDITGEIAPVQTVSLVLCDYEHTRTKPYWNSGDYWYHGAWQNISTIRANEAWDWRYITTQPTELADSTMKTTPDDGDVYPSGEMRHMSWHPTYPGGLTNSGRLTSGAGKKPFIYQSANSGLTAARLWSNNEGLWNDCDSKWLLKQWQLRHASLENSDIMDGCQAFNHTWTVTKAESATNRVALPIAAYPILTAAASTERYGEGTWFCVNVGTDADRSNAASYSIAQCARVLSYEYDDDGDPTCVYLYLELDNLITTTTSTIVSTMPFISGSTDFIPGHKDGKLVSTNTGDVPIRVAGVEVMDGAYSVSIEPLYVATTSNSRTTYAVHECRLAKNLSSSVTSNYIDTGAGNTTAWPTGWKYIKSFVNTKRGTLFPAKIGGSAATYFKSAFYVSSSSGARVPSRFGGLGLGAPAGLACCHGHCTTSTSFWILRPRLSGCGANRGEYAE